MATKGIAELKQLIKEMTGELSESKRSYHVNEGKEITQCRGNIGGLI